MPTPSEISVETKANTDIQNETNSVDTNLEAQDMQQKKKQLNQSPRRKNNSNRSLNMQPNRRNQGYHSKKNTNDNNKQSVYKQSNQQKQSNNLNPMSNGQQQSQDSSKKSSQRAYRTPSMYNKNHNGNVHYDLHADTTSAPPSLDNDFLIQQQIHSPGDHDVPRKYSKNFLHEVGYKLTSPKQVEEMAMRMALGDNSAYFGHYFARQLYGTQTQMMIQVSDTYNTMGVYFNDKYLCIISSNNNNSSFIKAYLAMQQLNIYSFKDYSIEINKEATTITTTSLLHCSSKTFQRCHVIVLKHQSNSREVCNTLTRTLRLISIRISVTSALTSKSVIMAIKTTTISEAILKSLRVSTKKI